MVEHHLAIEHVMQILFIFNKSDASIKNKWITYNPSKSKYYSFNDGLIISCAILGEKDITNDIDGIAIWYEYHDIANYIYEYRIQVRSLSNLSRCIFNSVMVYYIKGEVQ